MIADWHERVFVDELHHRVLAENPDGDLESHGRRGSAPGEFRYPRGVVVVGSRAYIVDSWNHRVQVFDLPSWKLALTFGSFGSEAGQFFCPSSITVSGDLLVIADTNNSRLSFHRFDGSTAFVFGLPQFPRRVRSLPGDSLEYQTEDGIWHSLEY